jgi:hypothetical protein
MKWPAPVDHLYILCDTEKEPDRAEYLYKWLRSHTIDDTAYTLMSACYGTTLSDERAHEAWNPWVNRKPVEKQRNFNSYNMKKSEISLCINWAAAARAAVDAKHKVVMIFESDVIFDEDFLPRLGGALASLPYASWDFLSISAGAKLRPPRAAGDNAPVWFEMKNNYFHTRTTDAMIFKVDMLEKILGTFFPFAEVLDWELNYQLTRHGSRTYWLDPPIIKQGSACGIYKTLL